MILSFYILQILKMGKHKHNVKRTGKNTKINMARRLERAKREWKSSNYIKDLETAVSKRH